MTERALASLPLPPVEFRTLVGSDDPTFFTNGDGYRPFPDLPDSMYSSVFDFGCGCGRLARQLIQQQPVPGRYLGVDRHRGMVDWCGAHLTPQAPAFTFAHHDVLHEVLNPGGTPGHLPLPAADGDVTLFIAWSVFTHLLEEDAAFYIRELSRVLDPSGLAVTTWFLFDKADYPMMQEFQNALFINPLDLTNAVIFDRGWLRQQLTSAGLRMTHIAPPDLRGFQWRIVIEKRSGQHCDFPDDVAPRGIQRPPTT
jgi:SAM-dependent methyltransferase